MWPTRDGVIPWRRFWLDFTDMWSVLALDRLNMMHAMLLAMISSHPTKQESTVRDLLDQSLNEAYPKE